MLQEPECEKILTNDLGLRMVTALSFIHQPDSVFGDAGTSEEIRYFSLRLSRFFSGLEILV